VGGVCTRHGQQVLRGVADGKNSAIVMPWHERTIDGIRSVWKLLLFEEFAQKMREVLDAPSPSRA
jgi:hypothetical protein